MLNTKAAVLTNRTRNVQMKMDSTTTALTAMVSLLLLSLGSATDQEANAPCVTGQGGGAVTSNPIPELIQSACGRLQIPENGVMDLTMTRTDSGMEQTATFSCARGHLLEGPNTLSCTNGNWKGREPVCKAVDCGLPEEPRHGRVDYSGTNYGSRAVYTCNKCYKMYGISRRSCKQSGLWSKRVPICLPEQCGPPPLPEKGYLIGIDSRAIFCGESISIACFYGYRHTGAKKATCLEGSYVWDGPAPQCNKWK